MVKRELWFILTLTVLIIQGCGVNSNVMWKQEKGAKINSADVLLKPGEEYKLSIDDKITFSLTTNDGAVLIDYRTGVNSEGNQSQKNVEYLIRKDGKVELPKIGKIHVDGLTIEACEDTLEYFYSTEYKQPFIQIKVTNKRVIVFPGNGSDAKVIPLLNDNTTLMEAIALAGGITDRGKSSVVKLMRKVGDERIVYEMDLSVIEGKKYADLVVQANDYIYIEPTPELSKEIAEDVLPIISVLSTILLIVSVINSFK